jgi:hypothetical protein
LMGNGVSCFGAEKGLVTDVDRAVLDLKILQRNLRKRVRGLERAISTQKEAFRALAGVPGAPGAKRKQELLLRHIGAIQKAIDQCHVYSYRADEMLLDIGEAAMSQRVTETVKEATRAMDRMIRLMRVEDVEAIQRIGGEARERHRELQAAMNVGVPERDEFYVSDAELAQLRTELDKAREKHAVGLVDVPSAVPASEVASGVRVEGEEPVVGLVLE